jgi:hypothetical protein
MSVISITDKTKTTREKDINIIKVKRIFQLTKDPASNKKKINITRLGKK